MTLCRIFRLLADSELACAVVGAAGAVLYQNHIRFLLGMRNKYSRRNPNWKPFKILWDYCERTGYDFFVARDIIFERLRRKLICECEMLRNDKKHRRMELESMFGVDFGGPGGKGLDLV